MIHIVHEAGVARIARHTQELLSKSDDLRMTSKELRVVSSLRIAPAFKLLADRVEESRVNVPEDRKYPQLVVH